MKRNRGRPGIVGPPCPVVMVRGIPPGLHQEVKMWARRRHCTLGEAYTALLTLGLNGTSKVRD